MNVLVTGSGGQLGTDIVPILSDAGFSITGLSSKALDITDEAKTLEAVLSVKPQVIINCAAYTAVDKAETEKEKAFKVNRDGARNLAGAAKKAGAFIVHVSTDFVFDGLKSTPYIETDHTRPLGVYGESKLAGERAVQDSGARYAIVRTSWLYGHTGNNFVKTIIRLATEKDSIRVVYDQTGSPTWTKELAKALKAFALAEANGNAIEGIYHFSNEGVASWYDFAVMIIEEARLCGVPIKCSAVEPILTSGYPTPAKRPPYSVLDKEKIKKALGIAIPHWRASLGKMMTELYGGKRA